MYRLGFELSACADHAMAAAPVEPSIRRRLQSARSPKASLLRVLSPMSWSPNIATTFRFTGRARSSPGKA
jgi:hypothetical protein